MISLAVLDCTGCGACCLHLGMPVGYSMGFPIGGCPPEWFWKSEDGKRLRAMPAALYEQLRQYFYQVDRGQILDRTLYRLPCLWYDPETKQCRHHEQRPDVCRELLVGGTGCLQHRQDHGIKP